MPIFGVGKVYRIWTPKGGPPQYNRTNTDSTPSSPRTPVNLHGGSAQQHQALCKTLKSLSSSRRCDLLCLVPFYALSAVFARGVSSSTTAQGHYDALQKLMEEEEDAGGGGK